MTIIDLGAHAAGKTQVVSMARVFEQVKYAPHGPQKEIHAARRKHRSRVAAMGRRTGKSTLGGHELTVKATSAFYRQKDLEPKGRRSEHWIIGPEYTDAEKEFRVVYNDLLKLQIPMDHPGTYYSAEAGQMDLSCFGGRFLVHAKSAKYPATLVGEGLESVIMAEAAKMKPNVWTKYVRPMLSDYAREGYGDALFNSTPEGKNWFYDLYMRGQNPSDTSWWSIRMPSWANTILFPEGRYDPEIVDMERDMSEEKFNQEIGADFTEFVGRVFKRFDEETHVRSLEYDPALPLYIAEDSGYTNPSVALFIQVDVWDNVYVIGEYYERHRTPGEFAADVLAEPFLGALARKATLMFPDPADPGTSATLANAWGVQSMGGTGGEIIDRLDLIRRWLTPQPLELEDGHPDKVPKLFFDRSCVNSIREMNDYRYPDTQSESQNARENPMKKDDHVPEALGRFFKGHFGQVFEPAARSRSTRARMVTRRGR